MKRKLKWLAIVLAVSLLGFATALLLWPRDRITRAFWEKIRVGMTEKEVAEMLGGPGMFWKETLLSIFPMRVFLTVSAIGLAGKGGAHETKTEMAGDCSRGLAAGIRHGIISVATR